MADLPLVLPTDQQGKRSTRDPSAHHHRRLRPGYRRGGL